jgi:predicted peptidase
MQSSSLGVAVGYLLQLPPDYDRQPLGQLPLLVFLHGVGERGNGTTELNRVLKFGPPRVIQAGRSLPFIVISPQLPVSEKKWPIALIDEVIAEARRQYRVDSLRIYLTGLSDGGDAAWAYAIARPDVPAAIVPMASTGSAEGICAMRGVAVWAFHGERDRDTPLAREAGLVRALNACRPPPAEPARLTVYQGGGHLVWSRTYDGSAGVDIYGWLLAHHR